MLHTAENSNPYLKSTFLIPGLEGTTYQVAVLMKYAFSAYRENRKFELLTEAAEFEKFDDLVIFYDDHVMVAQVKHGHATEAHYTLKDFIDDPSNDGKKVQLSKYFDAWYNIKKRMPDKKIIYKLISNHKIVISLQGVLEERKFSNNFINNRNLDPISSDYRTKIVDSIKKYSTAFTITSELQKFRFILKQDEIMTKVTRLISLGKAELNINRQDDWQLFLANYMVYDKDNTAKLIDGPITQCFFAGKTIPKDFQIHTPLISTVQKNIREQLTKIANSIASQNFHNFSLDSKSTLLFAGCVEPAENGQYKFNEAFILDDNKTPLQKYLRTKIVEILKNTRLNQQNQNIDALEDLIKKFLEEFEFEVNELPVRPLEDWLKKEVLDQFSTVFPGHYESFYTHMLRWLRDSTYTQNNQTIASIFQEAEMRLPWQYFAVQTKKYALSKKLERGVFLKDNIRIFENRKTEFNEINKFIEADNQFLLVVEGASSFANTTLLREFLKTTNRLKTQGEWLFFPAKKMLELEDLTLNFLLLSSKGLKGIILDNAEDFLLKDQLQYFTAFLQSAISSRKKLILVVSSQNIKMKSFLETIKNLKILKPTPLSNIEIEIVQKSYDMVNSFSLFGRKFSAASLPQATQWSFFTPFDNLNYLVNILEREKNKVSVAANYFESIPYQSPNLYETHSTYLLKDICSAGNDVGLLIQLKSKTKLQIKLLAENFAELLGQSVIVRTHIEANDTFLGLGEEEFNSVRVVFIDISQYDNNVLNKNFIDHISQHAKKKHVILYLSDEISFFNIEDVINLFQCHLVSHEDNSCIIHQKNSPLAISPYNKCRWPFGEYQDLLKKSGGNNQIVIRSKAGLGKSRLCSEVLKLSVEKGVVNDNNYYFVFIINLSQLTIKDLQYLGKSFDETLLLLITQKIAPISSGIGWETLLISSALEQGYIFMIYDGFDEVSHEQRVQLKPIYEHLFEYTHFMVCSRPEAVLPFSPTKVLKLRTFDREQVFNYITNYLSSSNLPYRHDPNSKDLVINKIDSSSHLMKLLEVPLHCQLFCETIFLQDKILSLDLLEKLTRLALYQNLVLGKIKVYLMQKVGIAKEKFTDVAHLYSFCHRILSRIAKTAFYQMGFSKDVSLSKAVNDEQEIMEFALITKISLGNNGTQVGYEFPHRTVEEYFAALYIAKGLCHENRSNEFYHLIKKYRYEPRFETVWQFLASIFFHGDPFIEKNLKKGLLTFCYALIASPRDLVGQRHVELIRSCFSGCDLGLIEENDLRIAFEKLVAIKTIVPNTPIVVSGSYSDFKRSVIPESFSTSYELSDTDKLKRAKQHFEKKNYDIRGNTDINNFYNAKNFFLQLRDRGILIEAAEYLVNYVETVFTRPTFDQVPRMRFNTKDVYYRDMRNKVGMALTILAQLSSQKILGDMNELFLCNVIMVLYNVNNSETLNQMILKALSDFNFYMPETTQFLKKQILEVKTRDSAIIISIMHCLSNQHQVDDEVIINLQKVVSNLDSITALEELVKLREQYPKVLPFIQNAAIELIVKRGLEKFQTLKRIIDILMGSFSQDHIDKIMRAVFLILQQKQTTNTAYFYSAPLDLIQYLLKTQRIYFKNIKVHLINCLHNPIPRAKFIEILASYNGVDENVVSKLLSFNDSSTASCSALLSLPKRFINDVVIFHIINVEGNVLDYLKSLIEKGIDFSFIQKNTQQLIHDKCVRHFSNQWEREKLFFVLRGVFGIEKALKDFIGIPFELPTLPMSVLPSPIPFLVSPANNVKITPNYTDLNRRFEVIENYITPKAIQLCWEQFLKTAFNNTRDHTLDPIEYNWHFFVIYEYVSRQKLAITLEDRMLTIYTTNGIINLKMEDNLPQGHCIEKEVKRFFYKQSANKAKEYADLVGKFRALEVKHDLNNKPLIFSNASSSESAQYQNSSTFVRQRTSSF